MLSALSWSLHGQGKIEPEEEKITAEKDYPTPVTKRDFRAFLGLVGYYLCFVPQFASLAIPLTNLTRKREPDRVSWSQDCETSFQNLKDALLQKPVLSVADPKKPFVLQTDDSNFSPGVVLSHIGEDGCEHPVAVTCYQGRSGMQQLRRKVWP